MGDKPWSTTKDILPALEEAMKFSARKTLDGKMPETYGFEIQVVCGRRDMVYKSTSGTEPFYSCVKAGVEQAKTREAEDGKEASKVEKLRSELEKAQQELDAIAEAAE